jgi:catechol 2,3-dioxygenase-like lactoylglutathione lyase family enzyme
MSAGLLTGYFFQVAYVVRDLDRAVAAMQARTGARNWRVRHLPQSELLTGAALAWVKGVMLELIAVDPAGAHPVYRDHVPQAADAARLHHLGYLFDTEAAFDARIAQSRADGFAAALHRRHTSILCYYCDTYARLGHYTEFVHLRPAARDFFADVPHN